MVRPPWPVLGLSWVLGQVFVREVGAGTSASEEALLQRLRDSDGAEVDGTDDLQLLRTCVSRSWWTAARAVVARTHKGGASSELELLQKEVTSLTSDLKQTADEFSAFSAATFRDQTQGLVEVNCAMQWAQNSTFVFLGVKYATRWSAPGAIEISDVSVNITPSVFQLEGFGHHSSIRKRYTIDLPLFADVVPEQSSWSAASVGRMTATFRKQKAERWARLPKATSKSKHQITSWLDMEERWADENVDEAKESKSKEKKAKKETVEAKKETSPSAKKEKGQRVHTPWRKKLQRWWKQMQKLMRNNWPHLLLIVPGLLLMLFAGYLFVSPTRDEPEGDLARTSTTGSPGELRTGEDAEPSDLQKATAQQLATAEVAADQAEAEGS